MTKLDTLIVVSLRGGADALNMLVPHKDENYYRARPTLALPRPGQPGKTVIDLDGTWGLHPSLEPLLPMYQKGEIAFVQAVGWPGDSHSHFEAWEEIESGTAGPVRPSTGWLARYLNAVSRTSSSPMRGAAFGEMLPKLLSGALGVSALREIDDFRLDPAISSPMAGALKRLFAESKTPLGSVGVHTLDALESLATVQGSKTEPSNYPNTKFGRQMSGIERLVRAGVGLEAASAELGGWDTHFFQGGVTGHMAGLLDELAKTLTVFSENLADKMDRIAVVVMSEFGRRVAENGSAGTDHGQGGLMMVLGGGVRGGRIYGDWPGLERLAGPGDVAITTDYRDVLGEITSFQLGERAGTAIFPDYRPKTRLGLFRV